MTDRPLNVPLKSEGDWFVPKEPSRRIFGTLEYDTQWGRLSLTDSFEPVTGKVTAGHTKRYRVVHGYTRDLGEVSLFDAVQVGLDFNLVQGKPTQPERLRAATLVIGRHVDPDTLIRSMDFAIPGLEVWLSLAVIRRQFALPIKDSPASQTVYIVEPTPESVAVAAIDGAVRFAIEVPMVASNEVTRFSIATMGRLTITSNTGQNLAWFLDQYAYLESLISLLAGTPMPVDQIRARFHDETVDRNILLALPKVSPCTATTVNDFFVPRGALGPAFEGLVQRWFAENSRLQLPVGLASNVLASQDLWTHLEFLSLLQALEGFHRATLPGTYMADADYVAVQKALGDAIPFIVSQPHKESLKSRIRYGNQVSLRKRMNGLLEWLPIPVRRLVLGNGGDFPTSWIDTRNFFTHWDKDLEQNVLTGQALYDANVRLRVLLRVAYLHFVGVNSQILEAVLSGTNPIAQHLIQLNFPETPILEVQFQDAVAAQKTPSDTPAEDEPDTTAGDMGTEVGAATPAEFKRDSRLEAKAPITSDAKADANDAGDQTPSV